ncbi:MAG: glycosyltransferase [Lewinellaceae bacterium]|nr:glycosyltransferase [Lewinellaceae bacterium]
MIIAVYCVLLIATIIYSVLIYQVQKEVTHNADTHHKIEDPKICIIISVRNESRHIAQTLESILCNDYPAEHYDILVINDHSTDKTAEIVSKFKKVTLLHLPIGIYGKKAAITFGIQNTNANKIILTDGDCIVEKDWILHHSSALDNTYINTGWIFLKEERNFLSAVQAMDVAATLAITKWAIKKEYFALGNGANMSIRRNILQGEWYSGNEHIASGDDIFLFEKIFKKDPSKIGFIDGMNGSVTTYGQPSWSSLLAQRLRWAAKQAITSSKRVFIFQSVIAVYLFLLYGVLLWLLWNWTSFGYIVIISLGIKFIVDYQLLKKIQSQYAKPSTTFFVLAWILYPIFYFILAFAALFRINVKWKDRPTLSDTKKAL